MSASRVIKVDVYFNITLSQADSDVHTYGKWDFSLLRKLKGKMKMPHYQLLWILVTDEAKNSKTRNFRKIVRLYGQRIWNHL